MEGERSITAVIHASAEAARMRKGTRIAASFGIEQVVLVQLEPEVDER
jgi:SpoU rRNA methylase family enzyme